MNRKLIALAVGAALVAPTAIADVSVFGKVRLSYGSLEDEETGNPSNDDFEVNNQASRLGFKGSEDLGGDLKANFFVEWGINPDSGGSDGLSSRNQWLGLSGGWGEVRFGRHDTPLKFSQGKFDVFNDQQGDFAARRSGSTGATTGLTFNTPRMVLGDNRVDNVLAYITPNFSGFKGAIAVIPGESAEADGTFNSGKDGAADFFSVAGTYTNGPIFLSAGYDDFDPDRASVTAGNTELQDSRYRLIGTYKFADFQVGAMYESTDFENNIAVGVGHDQYDVWGLSAKYNFGNNAIKAMYLDGTMELNAPGVVDEEFEQISVGFDHNFSKRTGVYAEYTNREFDYDPTFKQETTFIGVGLNHNF